MTTGIAWCDEVWNPVTGCDRVSAACQNCYALTFAGRLKAMGQPKYQNDGNPLTSGPGFGVTCHPSELARPGKWKRPRRIFVNSMSDLWHAEVPDQFIGDVFEAMLEHDQHTYLVLTKRPERMRPWLDRWLSPALLPAIVENIHGGVTIENNTPAVLRRLEELRASQFPIKWVSYEPALSALEIDTTGIDWMVIGCEQGWPGARPFDLGWARDMRDRCRDSGTAFYVKQLPADAGHAVTHGRVVDDIDQFPEDLRIREYPTSKAAA